MRGQMRTRRPNLTEAEKDAIREMRDRHPRMTYREIGARFKVNPSQVCGIITQRYRPEATKKPGERSKAAAPPPPSCTVQQPGSIIRPIPLSRLTAGR
jgi:hypothetical protein